MREGREWRRDAPRQLHGLSDQLPKEIAFSWWQVYVDDLGAPVIAPDAYLDQYVEKASFYQEGMRATSDRWQVPWSYDKTGMGALHTVRMGTEIDGVPSYQITHS